ncbi:hypothetical protein N7467_004269 [Penicillium canescens]|nr:hypothetical protein N7467_004269 [Penicillium canescens]
MFLNALGLLNQAPVHTASPDASDAISVYGVFHAPAVAGLTYVVMGLRQSNFESQILKIASMESPPASITATSPTESMDNYISIIHQFLGSEPLNKPTPINTPRYVTELPSRLDVSDLDYLESKGALCLPTAKFRKQLLKSYILWVHPQVPVLDLGRFLRSITANDGRDPISLLLFHAVMFAASAFVDISHIHDEGYISRNVAREVLFRRVKVLFELNCEEDPIRTVQALLLLIHWNDLPHSEHGAFHWVGICLSIAISIGLHRRPDESALTLSEQRMWRRTWWSVHNHTRLTAEDLLSVASMQEDREDRHLFDNQMLSLDDFELQVFHPEIRALVDDCELLQNIEYQKMQALIFIEKTKICQFSRFSSMLNRIKGAVAGGSIQDVNSHLKARKPRDGIEEHRRWQLKLPVAATPHCPLDLVPTECQRSIYLHQAWLRLIYLGSFYAACFNESQILADNLVSRPQSCSSLTDQCLLDMTDAFDEIDCLDLSEQLPCLSSAVLILALNYHQQASLPGKCEQRYMSSRSLHKCWNVLRKLRETSDLAARMTQAVETSTCDELWDRLSFINPL